ncbi:MAG: hypothetical protein JO273_22370 [Methylobacteriaceae bacterium]|nr:hypothetical protein [Methylobacteriaceae bacterium]
MSWFSHKVPYSKTIEVEKGESVAADTGKKVEAVGNVGSLVSTDALATFGGGTFTISLIWGVIEHVGNLPHNLWLGAIISLIVGLCLFGADAFDKNKAPEPPQRLRILAAVVNTFILFNAASGATGLAPPSTGAPSTTSPASGSAPK